MDKIIEGGCICKKIRYSFKISIPIDELQEGHCHCKICRKISGSILSTYVKISKNNIVFKGLNPSIYKSSEHCIRCFCSNCGSQLIWENKEKEVFAISIGSLDNPIEIKPKYHIWTENEILIDQNIPKYLQNF